jgi:hypothetical protein
MKRCLLLGALVIAFSVSGFGQEGQEERSPCASFPCIVASVALVNQTMSVHQVPVYTPSTTGFFRISYYEEAPGGFGIWTFTWNWTDDMRNQIFGPYVMQPGQYFNDGIPGMRVLAGHPITYAVTGNGGSYNLFAIVEQLQ